MVKYKEWIVGILVCGLLLSGCGVKQDKKTQSADNITPVPSAVVSENSQKDTEEMKKQPFYTYMEKYKNLLSTAEDWKTEDGKYHCPVRRNDLEQYDTQEEKHAACQIPEEILELTDTYELLELVFEFPYIHDIQYSNSYYEGVQYYAGEFNGLYGLLKRPDFYETVVTYYDKLDIPLHQKNHLKEKLPDNPTTKDYLATDEEENQRVEEDLIMEAKINFCIAVLGGMTENVEKDVVENAKKVLSKKYKELETSEYNDSGIVTREMLQINSAGRDIMKEVK